MALEWGVPESGAGYLLSQDYLVTPRNTLQCVVKARFRLDNILPGASGNGLWTVGIIPAAGPHNDNSEKINVAIQGFIDLSPACSFRQRVLSRHDDGRHPGLHED